MQIVSYPHIHLKKNMKNKHQNEELVQLMVAKEEEEEKKQSALKDQFKYNKKEYKEKA